MLLKTSLQCYKTMNSSKFIGGYFELELQNSGFMHSNAILLNSGRNCFEYILQTNRPTHVYIPKYICDVMIEPLNKLKVPYSFYSIDENLEIDKNVQLKKNELIVYVNYFGIKDGYGNLLGKKYGNKLVLDNSQALYTKPIKSSHTFYSPRKFFGLPDGGFLYTNKKLVEDLPVGISYQRFSHLIKRIDVDADKAYKDFTSNEGSLSDQPIMQMSLLTRSILGNIDFETARQKRLANFDFLHKGLKDNNRLQIDLNSFSCPMVYPYLTRDSMLRQKLIRDNIFIATYWPNVLNWSNRGETEYKLAKGILPLPIDQRYGIKEMVRILRAIND